MSQSSDPNQAMSISNASVDGQVAQAGGDLTQIQLKNVTFNQTQIIQISIAEIKTRPLNTTSPYRGLNSFDVNDRDYFFGRDQFLTGLVNELEQTNLVLLLGASGSGKSSVVRAGLIPWLVERQGTTLTALVFTPDQDPFESFYASLLSQRYKQSEAQIVRSGNVEALTQTVQLLKQPESDWFIFIDQFEELFTTSQHDRRDAFIAGIIRLSKMKLPDVKVMMTMRADFLDRLSPYPEFIKLTDRHRPMLAEMQRDELRLAIEQPAAHHGVIFEAGLVEEIIKDVQGQAGYLPLLQYTLNLLWETEKQADHLHDRTLKIRSYRNLGGIRGALQKRVDQIYATLSLPEQSATQRIFLRLVGIGGDADSETEWKPIRKRANREEFSDSLEQRVLIQLIDEKLLVSDRQPHTRQSTIELAHEVLLTSWTTLGSWIRENRSAISLRNRLNDDVERWQTKKAKDELWGGSKLEQVLELRNDQTFNQVLGGFTREANYFIDASERKRNRQRFRTVALWTGFSTLTLLSAVLFISLGTPFIARFFVERGFQEFESGNARNAIQNYDLALKFQYSPQTLYSRGRAYEQEENLNSAIADYKGAVSASSGNYAPAYNTLARLYILQTSNQKLYAQEAVKLLETALYLPSVKQLSQEDFEDYQEAKYSILKNLGWAKLKLRLYPEAKNILQQAISEDPKRGSAYCLLAQVAEAENERRTAFEEWKLCKEFGSEGHPDEKLWIEIAKQRLRNRTIN
jgi:tetratricopeptide (TPR) repeat protein